MKFTEDSKGERRVCSSNSPGREAHKRRTFAEGTVTCTNEREQTTFYTDYKNNEDFF
jgi:hypothetical protein